MKLKKIVEKEKIDSIGKNEGTEESLGSKTALEEERNPASMVIKPKDIEKTLRKNRKEKDSYTEPPNYILEVEV